MMNGWMLYYAMLCWPDVDPPVAAPRAGARPSYAAGAARVAARTGAGATTGAADTDVVDT